MRQATVERIQRKPRPQSNQEDFVSQPAESPYSCTDRTGEESESLYALHSIQQDHEGAIGSSGQLAVNGRPRFDFRPVSPSSCGIGRQSRGEEKRDGSSERSIQFVVWKHGSSRHVTVVCTRALFLLVPRLCPVLVGRASCPSLTGETHGPP